MGVLLLRVCLRRNVFAQSLPSNGHTNHNMDLKETGRLYVDYIHLTEERETLVITAVDYLWLILRCHPRISHISYI
jgi:hypothetical protein